MHVALVHAGRRQTWAQTRERVYRLASALVRRGVQRGDTVSVLAPNTPAMLEAHFGIPLSGAVLNAINCRLDAEGIAFILRHGESRVLLVDSEFSGLALQAIALLEQAPPMSQVIVVGACAEDDRILPVLGISKQMRFQFVFAYSPAEFADTLGDIAEGRIEVVPLLSGTVGRSGVAQAFEDLGHPGGLAKIIVTPGVA